VDLTRAISGRWVKGPTMSKIERLKSLGLTAEQFQVV